MCCTLVLPITSEEGLLSMKMDWIMAIQRNTTVIICYTMRNSRALILRLNEKKSLKAGEDQRKMH